jgi:ATP-dependent DNA helicase RecQ
VRAKSANWEALRTLRRKLAEEHSVPPYVIFPDSTLLEMLRSQPTSLSDMAQVSGVGARKLERYGQAFLEVLAGGTDEAPKVVLDLRHELVSLARAGMTPAQIAGQLNCSEKNVYSLLAEAIGRQELSLEQALDLPEELMMEVQDAFLDGEGELPPVSAVAPLFGRACPKVCCIAYGQRWHRSSNCDRWHLCHLLTFVRRLRIIGCFPC